MLENRLQNSGEFILRYSLVFFFGAFGAYKFTLTEATSIQPLMANSPFFSWLYSIFDIRLASDFIGVIEIAIAILIALRNVAPRLCALGSIGAAIALVSTLSFLFTTPGLSQSPSDAGFIVKDLTLLGAALWSAGEALSAAKAASKSAHAFQPKAA
jgi:uncharacterized membrane protein YkgB